MMNILVVGLTALGCSDGIWKPDEIEAIYGVHHVYSQKKSKVWRAVSLTASYSLCWTFQDELEHQKKAETVVKGVLERIDLNKDGVITPEELEQVGLDGLPNFDNLGAEGHHYDVESGASKHFTLIMFYLTIIRIFPSPWG